MKTHGTSIGIGLCQHLKAGGSLPVAKTTDYNSLVSVLQNADIAYSLKFHPEKTILVAELKSGNLEFNFDKEGRYIADDEV